MQQVKEQIIRCPHCNQRLLDAQYIVGTIKCFKCKQIIKLVIKDVG